MSGFRRILVAIDGSECAERALSRAVQLAKSETAELTILHVMVVSLALYSGDIREPFEAVEEAVGKRGERIILSATTEAEKQGIVPKTALLEHIDSPVKAITDYAEKNSADLIVIGTRGLGGFKRLLLGSVASDVVRYAPCPVLVVR